MRWPVVVGSSLTPFAVALCCSIQRNTLPVASDTDVGARSAGADVSVGSLVVLPICLADCISMRYTFIMLNRGDEKGSLCNDREFQTQRA